MIQGWLKAARERKGDATNHLNGIFIACKLWIACIAKLYDWNQSPYIQIENHWLNESARAVRRISQVPSIECHCTCMQCVHVFDIANKIAQVYVTGLRGHFDFIHWVFQFTIQSNVSLHSLQRTQSNEVSHALLSVELETMKTVFGVRLWHASKCVRQLFRTCCVHQSIGVLRETTNRHCFGFE